LWSCAASDFAHPELCKSIAIFIARAQLRKLRRPCRGHN
jgi:hypothetical protein